MRQLEITRPERRSWPTGADGTGWVRRKLLHGPRVPVTVTRAIRLLYLGAGLHLFFMLGWSGGELGDAARALRSWLLATGMHGLDPATPMDQVQARIGTLAELFFLVLLLVGYAVVGLWVLVALKTSEGRPWARYAASGLFVLGTGYAVIVLHLLVLPAASIEALVLTATWSVGLAALLLLWHPVSHRHFRGSSERE